MDKGKHKEGSVTGRSGAKEDRNNRSSNSPAHWQGQPLPRGADDQTQEIGFDQRGAGRARQYGRAGAYGQAHNDREERPQRGETQEDDALLDDVRDVFHQSGLSAADVVVRVNNGVVVLDGSITNSSDKYALERLAANCRGTVAVENRLEVGSTQANKGEA